MQTAIALVLSNFPLTFLVLGVIAAGVSLWRQPAPRTRATVIEALFSYYLLFSTGLGFFYNFIMHVFFGEMTARFIRWDDSPFQAEVGFASLGFAAVGFLAFKGDRGLRVAAVIGPALFAWGAAAGHVVQMITAHNFAPGNAGVVFYADIALPLIGFLFLALQRPQQA